MKLLEMAWEDRWRAVVPELAEELAHMKGPSATRIVANSIAERLGAPSSEIGRILVKMARNHPAASQSGETFVSFGKQARRWMWKPGVYDYDPFSTPLRWSERYIDAVHDFLEERADRAREHGDAAGAAALEHASGAWLRANDPAAADDPDVNEYDPFA